MDYEKKNFGINAGIRYDNKNLELVDEQQILKILTMKRLLIVQVIPLEYFINY